MARVAVPAAVSAMTLTALSPPSSPSPGHLAVDFFVLVSICFLCYVAGGDAHLGGDDWDQAIIDWLVANHLGGGKGKAAAAGLDLEDPRLKANLRALAEAAKRGLSSADEVVLRYGSSGRWGIRGVQMMWAGCGLCAAHLLPVLQGTCSAGTTAQRLSGRCTRLYSSLSVCRRKLCGHMNCRMPVGGPDGGPLQVVLTRAALEKVTEDLWRRARLPLDQVSSCHAFSCMLFPVMACFHSQRATHHVV